MEKVLELTLEEKVAQQKELENTIKVKTREISDLYYSQAISKLNKIVGLNSSSQFSLGLFLKLGIKFGVNHCKDEKEIIIPEDMNTENPDNVVKYIVSNMRAYVINEDLVKKSEVNITFNFNSDKDLDLLIKCFETEIGISFVTFVYLHEVQHILRRHNTSVFNEIMLKTAQSVKPDFKEYSEVHTLANSAEDYCINNALKELYTKSGGDAANEITTISKYGLFEDKYIKDNETDVLIKLLKSEPDIKVIAEDEHTITLSIQEKNEDGSNKGDEKIVTIPKEGNQDGDSDEDSKDGKSKVESNNQSDKLIDGLANSIQNHIDNQKEKGEGNFLLNEDLGSSIKTNIDWFDKLKSNFFTIVNRKTRQTLVNWSKLNSKFAHNHKSPTHKNIENTLNLILSVDNSGSMSNESLKKLLYIIEKKKSKISNITILKHTDTITGTLINETDEKKILEFLSKRDNGGTSHREIFKYLDDTITRKDIDNSIFISFSDNYSDIESEYKNFKNIRNITKVWLNADGKSVEKFIPGLKVDIF